MKRCIETRGWHRWHPSNVFFFFFLRVILRPASINRRSPNVTRANGRVSFSPVHRVRGTRSSFVENSRPGKKKKERRKKARRIARNAEAYNNSGGLNRKRKIASRQSRRGIDGGKKLAAESNVERGVKDRENRHGFRAIERRRRTVTALISSSKTIQQRRTIQSLKIGLLGSSSNL